MSMKERQAALNHRMKAVRNDDAAQGSKFACECADLRCNATLELTGDERTRRTSSPSRFWVKPGHELETERVVERDARYSVVQVDATPFFVVSAPAQLGCRQADVGDRARRDPAVRAAYLYCVQANQGRVPESITFLPVRSNG